MSISRNIEKTQAKRDRKAVLLASVRSGGSELALGMRSEDAITMLLQDIADFDEILVGLRKRVGGGM